MYSSGEAPRQNAPRSASPLVFPRSQAKGSNHGVIASTSGNNFPAAAVVNAVPGGQNTYSGDYTKTVALVGHKSAGGTVKLMDLTEAEYSVRYQGTTIVSKMALGTGVLRPESMAEIQHT